MTRSRTRLLWLCGVCAAGWAGASQGADWPQWGGRDARNMVSDEKGMPAAFDLGKGVAGTGGDAQTTGRVKWQVRLGTETYGNPTVAGGRVFVGTNNGRPRDGRLKGDRGVLLCLDEATGTFLWQLVVSKLQRDANFNGDYHGLGVCSSPTVDGDRVYVVTGRCEVVCLDVQGLADGNDGPFRDEGEYIAPRVRHKTGRPPWKGNRIFHPPTPRKPVKPLELLPTDADILWRYDFMGELDVWPQDATNCSVVLRGDLLYTNTSNGVDLSHRHIPSPNAPSLIALDKRTGTLVAVDDAGIGPNILHGQWSSPSLVTVGGKDLILFGGGDGVCYAFDATPAAVPGKKTKVLKTVWRCDCNPPDYRERDGKRLPYNKKRGDGPSEIIGTPVFAEGRVYVTIGQDTRHGPGKGALTCIDPTGTGDISRSGVLWRYTGINRSMATPSVADGLVFVADYPGDVHCLDATTGQCYWVHRTNGKMMGSTFVADGKVYVGNASRRLTVLAAAKDKKLLAEVRLSAGTHCTPMAANGILYVATQTHLYAIQNKR